MTQEELWSCLASKGIVSGSPPSASAQDIPWYMRVMLGCASWVGAFFLLLIANGILTALDVRDEHLHFVGIAVCVGAAYLLNRIRNNELVAQIGIAVSLCGQALIFIKIAKTFENNIFIISLIAAVVELALALIINNALHRMLCACLAALAVGFMMARLGFAMFILPCLAAPAAFLFCKEGKSSHKGSPERYLGGGFIFGAICTSYAIMFKNKLWLEGVIKAAEGNDVPVLIISSLCLCVIFCWMVFALLQREGCGISPGILIFTIMGLSFAAMLMLRIPGVIIGLLGIVAGFANGNRFLWGVSILHLITYFICYYYEPHQTFLAKSLVLFCLGAGMLGLLLLVRIMYPQDKREG